jgi:hypothetical protein
MCSDEAADSHRFMELLDAAVAAKEVPHFSKYTAWAKKVAARPRPKPGAAAKRGKARKEQQDAEAALVAQIRGRQQAGALSMPAGGILGLMLAKAEKEMPSEEDFQAARQRLEQRGGKQGKPTKRAKKS